MNGVAGQIEAVLGTEPDVSDIFSVIGFNFTGNGANRGVIFAALKPIDQRKGERHLAKGIVQALQPKLLGGITGALAIPFLPPAIQGVGSTGGFTFEVLDRSNNVDIAPLGAAAEQLSAEAGRAGKVGGLFSTFSNDDPQLLVTIDREKAKSIAVPFTQVGDALGVYLGSQYVNDFDFNNRSYRVYAQAASTFRGEPRDIGEYYVRAQTPTGTGGLTPLDNLVHVSQRTAPPVISHYNLFRSIELNGTPSPGVSSGEAIAALQQTAARVLPPEMGYEWSGLSWEEVRTGRQSLVIFALGLAFAFLVLSAQYESFALPFIIILAVPLALLGALLAVMLRGLVNDVFCQVGLLMLIGLASKNAILIVEFAEQLRQRGASALDAVVQAAMLRLRPILMTSLAFLLGVLPLVFAAGAGAQGRRSLGTAVFGGLLLSTVLNLFFTPALYLFLERARERLRRRPAPAPAAPPAAPPVAST